MENTYTVIFLIMVAILQIYQIIKIKTQELDIEYLYMLLELKEKRGYDSKNSK